MTTTYKQAGVDIDAGNKFVLMIKELIAEAWPDTAKEIGGFAGGGPIPPGARRLMASTDGPGTKAILAAIMRDLRIGQDVVAMSAVDSYVAGVLPKYLLDYFSVAVLEPEHHIKIIASLIEACKMAGCILIGGETAEMPDLYAHKSFFDLATFVIGLDDSRNVILGNVEPGDKLYGWPSYGMGSNGGSLVRTVFSLKGTPQEIRKRMDTHWDAFGKSLGDAILEPTPIWIREIERQREMGVKFAAHAHITGGGIAENLARALPPDCMAGISADKWERPPLFPMIQRAGNVPSADMDRTFNQGLIMISVVKDRDVMPEAPAIFIGEVEDRRENMPPVMIFGNYCNA